MAKAMASAIADGGMANWPRFWLSCRYKHPAIPGRLGAAGSEQETPRFERRSLQVWFRRLGPGGELAGLQEV